MNSTRRSLLCVAGAAAVHPGILRAEGKGPRRIIWLGYGDKYHQRVRDGFKSRGILEGRDITLTFQALPADNEKEADELAESLVRNRPDAIVLPPHSTIWSLKKRTRDIPVIFLNWAVNPAKFGIVESLARPGGNFTGTTLDGDAFAQKGWHLFKQLVPAMKRVGLIVDKRAADESERRDPSLAALRKEMFRSLEADFAIEIIELRVPEGAGRDEVARIVTASGANAAMHIGKMLPAVVEFLSSASIPSFCVTFANVRKGCLLGLSFAHWEGENYAIRAIERILRGESPAVIPVYQTHYEFALNRRRARELGVEIPASLLIGAREIYD